MTTMHHPTLPDVTAEVADDAEIEAWSAQGWLKSAPAPEAKAVTVAAPPRKR